MHHFCNLDEGKTNTQLDTGSAKKNKIWPGSEADVRGIV